MLKTKKSWITDRNKQSLKKYVNSSELFFLLLTASLCLVLVRGATVVFDRVLLLVGKSKVHSDITGHEG